RCCSSSFASACSSSTCRDHWQRWQTSPCFPPRKRYRRHAKTGSGLARVVRASQRDEANGRLLKLREGGRGRRDQPCAILLGEWGCPGKLGHYVEHALVAAPQDVWASLEERWDLDRARAHEPLQRRLVQADVLHLAARPQAL